MTTKHNRYRSLPSVPACAHNYGQGRSECPSPQACQIPGTSGWNTVNFDQLFQRTPRVTGANVPTWRAQIHETAQQAEGLIVKVAICVLLFGTLGAILAPAEWIAALQGHLA
jgi:hypothetical protein